MHAPIWFGFSIFASSQIIVFSISTPSLQKNYEILDISFSGRQKMKQPKAKSSMDRECAETPSWSTSCVVSNIYGHIFFSRCAYAHASPTQKSPWWRKTNNKDGRTNSLYLFVVEKGRSLVLAFRSSINGTVGDVLTARPTLHKAEQNSTQASNTRMGARNMQFNACVSVPRLSRKQ